jgi:hypothetical protein
MLPVLIRRVVVYHTGARRDVPWRAFVFPALPPSLRRGYSERIASLRGLAAPRESRRLYRE